LAGTGQRRAEQSRAEQSRAEQSRAEQSRAEQSRAEQSRAEQRAYRAALELTTNAAERGFLEKQLKTLRPGD
jgi:predicted RNA polymerase sigma factor